MELRKQSTSQLKEQLAQLRAEQLKLGQQRQNSNLPKSHLVKENRKQVARIKTILREKGVYQE